MEWTSSFVKRGQDQTKLGFNLSFAPVAVNASITGASGGGGGGYMEVRGIYTYGRVLQLDEKINCE